VGTSTVAMAPGRAPSNDGSATRALPVARTSRSKPTAARPVSTPTVMAVTIKAMVSLERVPGSRAESARARSPVGRFTCVLLPGRAAGAPAQHTGGAGPDRVRIAGGRAASLATGR
jgi:hypothetical protein